MSLRGFIRTIRIFTLAISLLISAWRIGRITRRAKNGRTSNQEKIDRLYERMGVRVRTTALHLQGLMVKVGQFLSTRTDVFPTSFTRELRSLQDAVPAVPFEQIQNVIEKELGSGLMENFSSFQNQAVAAASLGQVHIASLAQGGKVAVKILRPGIERLAQIDLRALRVVVRFLERFSKVGRRIQAFALYREFAATVHEELDYRQEAKHLLRFQKQFAGRTDIVVPRVFENYSARRVLVMEFIEGIKINNLDGLKESGIAPNHVVEILIDAYIEQLLVHGFIHADPHPGNLLVLSDGRLCFLDFGMMSDIPRSEALKFAQLLLAGMVRDVDTVVACIEELGFLQPYADMAFLKKAIGFMIDQIQGMEWKKGPEFDQFLEEFQEFLRDEPIIIQAKYMFLGRALGMVSGLINTLAPNIKWADLLQKRALPRLTEIVEEGSKEATGRGSAWMDGLVGVIQSMFGQTAATASRLVISQLQSAVTSTIRLPQKVERVMDKLDRNELEIKLELSELYDRLEKQQVRVNRFLWSASVIALTGLVFWLRAHGHLHVMWGVGILDVLAFIRCLWILKPSRKTKKHRHRYRTR